MSNIRLQVCKSVSSNWSLLALEPQLVCGCTCKMQYVLGDEMITSHKASLIIPLILSLSLSLSLLSLICAQTSEQTSEQISRICGLTNSKILLGFACLILSNPWTYFKCFLKRIYFALRQYRNGRVVVSQSCLHHQSLVIRAQK